MNFVHDVFAIALDVTVDDDGASGEPLADHHRREELPFLARVKVAVDVRQVPSERLVNGAVENQRGRDRAAERRLVAIPWIVVAGARDVSRDQFGRDVVGDAAEVAADVNFFAIENFTGHHAVLRALVFLFGFEAIVELGGVDHRASMAPGANLLDVIEGAHRKLEAAGLRPWLLRLRRERDAPAASQQCD